MSELAYLQQQQVEVRSLRWTQAGRRTIDFPSP